MRHKLLKCTRETCNFVHGDIVERYANCCIAAGSIGGHIVCMLPNWNIATQVLGCAKAWEHDLVYVSCFCS